VPSTRDEERDELLIAFLREEPDHKRALQRSMDAIFLELAELKGDVELVRTELKEEIKGVSARVTILETREPGKYRVVSPAPEVVPLNVARKVVFDSIRPAEDVKASLKRGDTGSFKLPEHQLDKLLAERDAAKEAVQALQRQRWVLSKLGVVLVCVACALAVGMTGLVLNMLLFQARKTPPALSVPER
jgi:hypothetical protein